MIELHDKASGARIGAITEDDLEFLVEQLEEEASDDQDYYINEATLDMFAEAGASESLLALLRGALKGRQDMEIHWTRRK